MTDRTWGKPELESSLPHIIVDEKGVKQLPRTAVGCQGQPIERTYPNRAVATRLLNQLKRGYNPTLLGNPKTWRVETVREK